MLLFKRLLVIPLGLLLLAALFFAFVFLRLDGTALNPTFYKQQLNDAKFYDFLLGDFLSSTIDEFAGDSLGDEANGSANGSPDNFGLSTERVARSVRTAFTSEWLRGEVESSIDQVVPYVSGDSDEFEIDIQFKHQAEVLLVETKALQRESKSYELAVHKFIDPLVEDSISDDSLFGLDVPSDRVKVSVHEIVTDEWMHDQIDVMIDGITPYLVGDQEDFRIVIPLNDRAEIAVYEFKRMMREVDGYDKLYSELIEAQVLDAVGDSVELPGGLILSREEMASILLRVVPPQWVEVQVETIIDDGTDYLIGNEDEFSTTISLATTKLLAREIVIDVATRKVLSELEALPDCNRPLVSEDFGMIRFDEIPECMPSDVNVDGLQGLVSERVSGSVTPLIAELIPDDVTFTHDDLRDVLLETSGQEGLAQFEDARQIIKEGWVYTSDDLHRNLSNQFADSIDDNDSFTMLENTRNLIAEGWTFTEDDLIEGMQGSGSLETLESARGVFKWVSVLPWLLLLFSLGLVAAIGFLGGTTWRTRVVWGSGVLTTVSLLILVGWNLVYNELIKPQFINIMDTLNSASASQDGVASLQGMLIGKISEIFESSLDLFAIGITNISIALLVISLIVFFVSYFWNSLRDNYERMYSKARQLQMRTRMTRSQNQPQ